MSNVLIGIIGVILFIGLALAGALFLGPRFQQSTNSSKGSAAVQAVSQIASSANMSNVQSGAATPSATAATSLQTNGYLKTVPTNPVSGGGVPILVDGAGLTDGTAAAKTVLMDLGSASGGICTAIAQQSGQTLQGTAPNQTAPAGSPVAPPTSPSGCFIASAAGATGSGIASGDMVAFATI